MRLGTSLSVAFSPDGNSLATLSERSVRVVSSRDGSVGITIKARHPSHVRFSPNGRNLLVKTTSGKISLHDLDSGRSQVVRAAQGEGPAPEFATDGLVVNVGWNGVVEVIDLVAASSIQTRQFKGEMLAGLHRCGEGWVLHHSPNATSDDRPPDPCYFTQWSTVLLGDSPRYIRPELRFIRGSSLHPSCATLAVLCGAPPNQLVLIDTSSSTMVATRPIEPGGTGSGLAWSHDGQRLAVVEENAARVYGQDLALLYEARVQHAASVAFAPKDNVLAIGSWQDGCIIQLP